MASLAHRLLASAASHPDRPAVRLGETTLTYRELDVLTARAAGWLRSHGVGAGDRVGIMIPNVLAFPVLYYGVMRVGAIAVPMNPLLRSREVAHYVTDSDMTLLVTHAWVPDTSTEGVADPSRVLRIDDASFLEALAQHEPVTPVESIDDTDTAVILYTSGTTGSPKGAELTHGNLIRNCEASVQLADLQPTDVILGCLPLFHAFGQSVAMNASIAAGSLLSLVPRFDPESVLATIERDQVTIFDGVPSMYVALLQHGLSVPTESLRLCVSGGASLPAEILRGFKDMFGATILEGYGLSETSPTATFNRAEHAKVGSIGTPIPGVELRLVSADGSPTPPGEIGEIAIRGHNVMKGYWRRPEETAAAIRDGWFHTGDLARVDEDGFYYIVDRLKELIIRGGFNVYPREVEEVLYEHPAILEAAVFGVPHASNGEEVVAAVALRPGESATAEEIRDFAKVRLAPYKYPREVMMLAELPKGSTGKILKREIPSPSGTA